MLHVCHVIYRFDVGGMENGIVNLINHMPVDNARHTIISLTHKTDFASRLQRNDVELIELHKKPGNDIWMFIKLYKLFRKLRPDIVHTRNHPTTEIPFVAKLAGVKACVHGEHGRDVHDLDGSNRKYRLLKKLINPFIDHYICVSKDLEKWLHEYIGIHKHKITQIYNGVDSNKFRPDNHNHRLRQMTGFSQNDIIIGAVGRMEEVKGHIYLTQAFIGLLQKHPELSESLRLVILGDGSQKDICEKLINEAGFHENIWFPGSVDNVNELLSDIDVFVLPSLAEGISNTILEAMSCGLPVIATDVGGNSELVTNKRSGLLVTSADSSALANTLYQLVTDPELCESLGQAGRDEIERRFSMTAMVNQYLDVYCAVSA